MFYHDQPPQLRVCARIWQARGYVPLREIHALAAAVPMEGAFAKNVADIFRAFNQSDAAFEAIERDIGRGDMQAIGVRQFIRDHHLDRPIHDPLEKGAFGPLRAELLADPEHFMQHRLKEASYPHHVPGRTLGYRPDWVETVTGEADERMRRFADDRRSDTAILVGNGPSLRKIDFDLFRGQDMFLSNYAIKNADLARQARGVAVTNYLVAEQEPFWFQLGPIWKFHPLWLANTLAPTDRSVLLNALGGELFFSRDVTRKVAWHSTVTYFWLQILYSAGYRKVLMTGFDHYYQQKEGAQEGQLIKQTSDDANHFDPNYFKGKNWQAADVDKMEETYALSKEVYEADGREIVNCTVGGHLELFRRAELGSELAPAKTYGRPARTDTKPRIAVVTSFWKGDVEQTELHWRLLNRLGKPNPDHIHLFKHRAEDLPTNTLPRVICADIEGTYPQASRQPHPAGPNLVFAHAVRTLLETGYTHFFWMEPDCVPTDADWLKPFEDGLERFPDEPIIGTGGGTVTPGKPHWKHHFAGCSLYSLKHLAEIDWDAYIEQDLHISFDVWLAVRLGYIRLLDVNNDDQTDTIIFGADRYNWEVLRRPDSVVCGMFEHWRPEKFLSPEQLEERLSWPGFDLYHAIKSPEMITRLYQRLAKSASTVVINYNNGTYLEAAIRSALDQNITDIDYEVIVVDDGSTDESRRIIESFGDRIRPIFLEHGLMNGNFNQQRGLKAGVEAARGEVILFLDGDDVFFGDKVAWACRTFDDSAIVLCQHTLKLIDDAGAEKPDVCQNFPAHRILAESYQKLRKVDLYQPTSGLAFRRSYLESQLRHAVPDSHEITWTDVRTTRFAPYYGKIYSSQIRHGAWRRHAASDSIRVDNIRERIQSHERWFDDYNAGYGFPAVSFPWKPAPPPPGPSPLLTAKGSFLQRLAAARADTPLQLLLCSHASALLLDPDAALGEIERDPDLAQAISDALDALPETDALKRHVRRVQVHHWGENTADDLARSIATGHRGDRPGTDGTTEEARR